METKLSQKIILTNGVNMETNIDARNNNIFVLGGTLTEREDGLFAPNLLQGNSSYIVADVDGRMMSLYGDSLKNLGYDVKVFDPMDADHSSRYNPFAYLDTDSDILAMVRCLTKADAEKERKELFWEKAETIFFESLIYYIIEKNDIQKKDKTVSKLNELIKLSQIKMDGQKNKTRLDKKFDELIDEKADSKAYVKYQEFKDMAGESLQGIIISCGVRLSIFNLECVMHVTETDDIGLENIRNKKTAVFIKIPGTDTVYHSLFGMLLADAVRVAKSGKYPLSVMIPDICACPIVPELVSAMSSAQRFGKRFFIGVSELSPMSEKYLSWQGIIDACDIFLYLGTTNNELSSEYIGKKISECEVAGSTDTVKCISETPDGVTIDIEGIGHGNTDCIAIIANQIAIVDNRYTVTNHPNYQLFER